MLVQVTRFQYESMCEIFTMLILSRRVGETIRISNDVTVTVLNVHGKQARFGIDTLRAVSVDREEIAQRKKESSLRPLALKWVERRCR